MACKLAIPTASLGHCSAGHSLDSKLAAAQSYGYQGVEISYDDVQAVAGQGDQTSAALKIRSKCQKMGVEIVCLQPFPDYEGLVDRSEHQVRYSELLNWLSLARTLGTDMVMIPANALSEDKVTDNLELVVKDLQKAADAAWQETPHIRIAYESRCSATRIDRWEFCWDVVKKVGRPNFGVCLDAVHIAGRIFADPAASSGCVPDGYKMVELSMHRFIQRVKAYRDRIFYVQMGDARRPDEPIVPGSSDYDPKQPPRMIWSRNYRLFYREEARGAYLPMREIAEAIFNGVGFEGWVSLELFNRRMDCQDSNLPMDLARRGAISWHKLANDMGWWPTLTSNL
ncbi:hypothetical protein MMC10_006006 [Thelotrema lepadinum]|nr:hypothetical protein [Thelotrema lepadinum]